MRSGQCGPFHTMLAQNIPQEAALLCATEKKRFFPRDFTAFLARTLSLELSTFQKSGRTFRPERESTWVQPRQSLITSVDVALPVFLVTSKHSTTRLFLAFGPINCKAAIGHRVFCDPPYAMPLSCGIPTFKLWTFASTLLLGRPPFIYQGSFFVSSLFTIIGQPSQAQSRSQRLVFEPPLPSQKKCAQHSEKTTVVALSLRSVNLSEFSARVFGLLRLLVGK